MQTDPLLPPRDLTERVRRALERITDHGEPAEVAELAEALFRDAYGETSTGSAGVSAAVPLIAEHTRYFGGFGLLMRLPGGVGVAIGTGKEGLRATVTGEHESSFKRLFEELYAHVTEEGGHAGGIDVAAVCAAPSGGEEASLAAVGVAFLRALASEGSVAEMSTVVTSAMEVVLDRPCGPSHVLAALDGGEVVLVDTGTHEHVTLDRPEALGVAIVEVGAETLPDASAYAAKAAMLESSLRRLRENGHDDLTSLRRLEHQDLPHALALIDTRARPFLRHLATEDRRVQRLVVAAKREDVQVLGALLLMSHASRRDDARASTEEVEYVLGLAQSAEGVYGARMAGPGHGGRVLLVGRPFLLPDIVDGIAQQFMERFGTQPRTTLL